MKVSKGPRSFYSIGFVHILVCNHQRLVRKFPNDYECLHGDLLIDRAPIHKTFFSNLIPWLC